MNVFCPLDNDLRFLVVVVNFAVVLIVILKTNFLSVILWELVRPFVKDDSSLSWLQVHEIEMSGVKSLESSILLLF